ncbi:MAG: hypothetical protein FJ026_06980, partial [Chloroflexi bacterium]|nr:hypothetical protein [Chloroflexota bacterium]
MMSQLERASHELRNGQGGASPPASRSVLSVDRDRHLSLGAMALRRVLVWALRLSGAVLFRRKLAAALALCADVCPSLGPRGHTVLRVEGQAVGSLALRLCEPAKMPLAMRHLVLKAFAQHRGIRCPSTVAWGEVSLADKRSFAVLEEWATGEWALTWTPEMAYTLGCDLARWHEVQVPAVVAAAVKLRTYSLARYSQYPPRLRKGQQSCGSLPEELSRSLQALDAQDSLGRWTFSHGDVHGRNILSQPDGRLIWLDLELAGYRPQRHDLAWVEWILLRHHPVSMEAFEQGYFQTYQGDQRGWQQHRLDWYRLCCALRAARLCLRS